jgi:acetyl esterase
VHAIHFAANNAHRWGGNAKNLVLAGDSAGANLAAAAAVELANSVGAPPIQAIALLYGVFDFSGFSETGITRLLADAYLGGQNNLATDPRVSPLVAGARLPPAHIAVGSADPLIDDSNALRSVLAKAGNVHDYHVYDDMPHAFMQMELLPPAQQSIQKMADFLHRSGS